MATATKGKVLSKRIMGGDEDAETFLSTLTEAQFAVAKVLVAPWGYTIFYPGVA